MMKFYLDIMIYITMMLPLYELSQSLNMVLPTVSILNIPLDPTSEKSKKNKEIKKATFSNQKDCFMN